MLKRRLTEDALRTPALLLPRIGEALLEIQRAEKALKQFIGMNVQGFGLSWEEIVHQDERERAKTLGRLVRTFRKSIPIREDFDKELTDFVKDRNILVHDIHRVPGFNLGTQQGLAVGMEFIICLTEKAMHVADLLLALMKVIKGEAKFQHILIGPGVDREQAYELLAVGTFLQHGIDDGEPVSDFD